MPDVTVSFTESQWTRMVAASGYILRIDEGDIDATKLAAKWKALETDNVKAYEQAQASLDEF